MRTKIVMLLALFIGLPVLPGCTQHTFPDFGLGTPSSGVDNLVKDLLFGIHAQDFPPALA